MAPLPFQIDTDMEVLPSPRWPGRRKREFNSPGFAIGTPEYAREVALEGDRNATRLRVAALRAKRRQVESNDITAALAAYANDEAEDATALSDAETPLADEQRNVTNDETAADDETPPTRPPTRKTRTANPGTSGTLEKTLWNLQYKVGQSARTDRLTNTARGTVRKLHHHTGRATKTGHIRMSTV
jgi:hypothetical protein